MDRTDTQLDDSLPSDAPLQPLKAPAPAAPRRPAPPAPTSRYRTQGPLSLLLAAGLGAAVGIVLARRRR